MRIKEEIKVIEQRVVTYVAKDGKEFTTLHECKKHEETLDKEELINAAEKMRMKELDESLPLSVDGLMNENNTFRWYKLQNQKDFETLNRACGNTLSAPQNYPEIMCVETVGYEAYKDDAYSYSMTVCRNITESFWKKLGYTVTFEQMD